MRNIDKKVSLNLQIARDALKEFDNKKIIPKDISSALSTNKKLGLGINECAKHLLLEPFKIMKEKKNEYIARIGFTIILRNETNDSNGQIIIAARSLDSEVKKFDTN